MSDSLQPHEPSRLLYPWNFPGKNPGVGGHFLPPRIFPAQDLNPRLLHWQLGSLLLSHLENPCWHITSFLTRKGLRHTFGPFCVLPALVRSVSRVCALTSPASGVAGVTEPSCVPSCLRWWLPWELAHWLLLLAAALPLLFQRDLHVLEAFSRDRIAYDCFSYQKSHLLWKVCLPTPLISACMITISMLPIWRVWRAVESVTCPIGWRKMHCKQFWHFFCF